MAYQTSLLSLSVIFLLGGFGDIVHADTVWKVRRPDGTYEYGNTVAPAGASKIETGNGQTIPAFTAPPEPASVATPTTTGGSAKVDAVDEAHRKTVDARQRLEAAERALIAGEEPLPGERQGMTSDGARTSTRLSEEYFTRQERLRGQRDAAKDAYDEALRQEGRAK